MSRYATWALAVALLVLPLALVGSWTGAAAERLKESEADRAKEPAKVAVAEAANEQYCTADLKKILRRVLQSCGLIQSGTGRGCQPADAKNIATMSGEDFNALFVPMLGRGGIVQFEQESNVLDAADLALVEKVFADRRGASYFFVVARASPEGAEKFNSDLSQARAEAVLAHLEEKFHDPDLQREVGLLWLGEEYAQLNPSFCQWNRSGGGEQCTPEALNRSAFLTWIDCTL